MPVSVEELFVAELKEEVDRHAEDLVIGSADDYSEYREKVGYIRGVMFAADAFKSIANRARKDDSND